MKKKKKQKLNANTTDTKRKRDVTDKAEGRRRGVPCSEERLQDEQAESKLVAKCMRCAAAYHLLIKRTIVIPIKTSSFILFDHGIADNILHNMTNIVYLLPGANH
ncbi:hypothetical protein KIN20_020084 [Parelaphostrongylus tenuis]|uniref:Uncharacterized protein n=1 Tax=Parelaphostrongylus tenuis TaxID=148309 RepID=A0AAD5N2W1_PARTN|nr:hypothetical protein KIN20_020084 [Parelaphostrongylus tenuis]